MSCSASATRGEVPTHYSLFDLATPSDKLPACLDSLESWLELHSPEGRWRGKIYVACTISWNEAAFLQEGCSPNYRAGWWSLTCCKHTMRAAEPLRRALESPEDEATFIFTLAAQDNKKRQGLVSVAKVTEHFDDMRAYANYLRETQDAALISSRYTRPRKDDGHFGWRFGDCHADRRGPDKQHVHAADNFWRRDANGGHALLLSDSFLLWAKPTFFAGKVLKQSGFGHNIGPRNLTTMLIEGSGNA